MSAARAKLLGLITPSATSATRPVLADKATAKAICDASRRAYCASAAAFFSLNYETYVDEEFEPQEQPVEPRASVTANSIDVSVEPSIEEVQGVLMDELAGCDRSKRVETYINSRAAAFKLKRKVARQLDRGNVHRPITNLHR